MELRPDASHKENVPPRPAAPLRPEQRRFLKSRDVGLGSGCGRWVRASRAQRGGPATTPSPGAGQRQEPCRVQTNLAGQPSPSPSPVPKGTAGQLMNASLQQQSNLQPPAGTPRGRAREFAIQQSNLSMRGTSSAQGRSPISHRLWPHMTPQGRPRPQGSLACPWSSPRQSRLLARDTLGPDVQPDAGFGPFSGHTRRGSRPWCGLGSWPSRLRGKPLTLEDLTVPVQSQAPAPSQTAIRQLLASVRHLEHAVNRLRCQVCQEPSNGQVLPTHPQPSQPVPASWDGRKEHLPGLRETLHFPETPGTQVALSDSQASRKPASLETTLGILTGDFLDPKQGVLQAKPLRQGENFSPGPTDGSGQRGAAQLPRGSGSKEARLCSLAGSGAAWGVPPRREGGEVTLQEQVCKEEESAASCSPDAAPARIIVQKKARNVVSLESETARRQWLSRCFRAWWHLVQKRRAAAAAAALGRRQLLRRGLWALRRVPRLREAQLEVARQRHTQALLTQSFQKWRNRSLQQKQGQPHVQTGTGPPPSGVGQGQGPSGREPVADPIRRSSPESPREEAGAWPRPAGGDGVEQMLQILQQLAVFLLWFPPKEWAWQERGVQGEASQVALRTQRRGRPPRAPCSPVTYAHRGASPDTEQQRAWLGRCFGAWQKFMLRAAQYRDCLARCRAGTLRLCVQQWMWMKQLRASDAAKVTQLSLCRQKAGKVALCSSAPGGATAQGLGVMARAQGLPPEQGGGSLQEACKRLALHRVLLLWRTRLSQRHRADSFLQGMRRQVIRRILRGWHLKVWGPSTPSDSARTTLAPELLGSILGGEPLLDGSPPRSSLEKASRTPAFLETLPLSLLWASGQQQRAQCLLPCQVRVQESRGPARWHQCTLQRRTLLSWSHWATAQGAQRELAVAWAWDRSCRAALGLWRQRLAQGREVEQWVRARGRTRVRGALHRWHSCWQRQQSLRARYQTWVQVHLRALRGTVFQDWRQAAARRRHPGPSPEPCLLHRQPAVDGSLADTKLSDLNSGHCAPLTSLLSPGGLVRGNQASLLPRWLWDLVPHLLGSHDLWGTPALLSPSACVEALDQSQHLDPLHNRACVLKAQGCVCKTMYYLGHLVGRFADAIWNKWDFWTPKASRAPPSCFSAVSRPGVELKQTQGWSRPRQPVRMARERPWGPHLPRDRMPEQPRPGHRSGVWPGPPWPTAEATSRGGGRAQQAFTARRAALGRCWEACRWAEERAALCCTQWVHKSCLCQVSRACAAQKLSARILEAWAQSAARVRDQQAAITQFQQAGSRRRAVLLSMRLEPQGKAPEAHSVEAHSVDLRQWPRVASRGRLLALTPAPALWKQTHGYGTLPRPSQHHSHGGQRKPREVSWAQNGRERPLGLPFQRRWQRPGCAGQTQVWPPTRPGGDCYSVARALQGQGEAVKRQLGRKYLQRWHREALLCRLQGSQRARSLAAAWQHWVDAQGAVQLARTLLRQWHLTQAWRVWRRRALQLWVAQRLQQQESGRVLSQVFEKWRQRLAARGQKRSHQQSDSPESGGRQEPGK